MAVNMTPELLEERLVEARQSYKLNVGCATGLTAAGGPFQRQCKGQGTQGDGQKALGRAVGRQSSLGRRKGSCKHGAPRARRAAALRRPVHASAQRTHARRRRCCCARALPPGMRASRSCRPTLWTRSSAPTPTSWSWSCPGAAGGAGRGSSSCGSSGSGPARIGRSDQMRAIRRMRPHAAPCAPAHAPHAPPPRSNNLAALPEELSEFKHLRVLRLKYNALRKLPRVIAALPQLTTLELAGNQITRLESAVVAALSSLKELDLSGNALTELPAAIARLPKLEALHLENNRCGCVNLSIRVLLCGVAAAT